MSASISEPDIVSALRLRLPTLPVIYLFGSRATGHAGTDNDLDLAVLVEGKLEPLATWELAQSLADACGCDVDLIDLRTMITMHPGEYLFLPYVEPHKISHGELADRLRLPLQAVEGLLAKEIALTAEMAVRHELVFDRSAMSWMEMQAAHDVMQARKKVDTATVRPFVLPARADAA